MGIDVLPPDVNASDRDFAVRDGKIRFGLSAVKNVGDNAVRAIVQAREEGGPFHSVWDFCERVDWQHVTARVLESLIRAGRARLHRRPAQGHDRSCSTRPSGLGRKLQADRNAGQGNLFESLMGGGGEDAPRTHPPVPPGEWGRRELLSFERETLGLYLSSHPLADVRGEAAPPHRLRARRARRPQRRRDGDHRGADRLDPAADDQEGRPDGLRRSSRTRRAAARSWSSRTPSRRRAARSTSTGSSS